MERPVVDPEFQSLTPPLAEDERRLLEEGILAEGCRDPIVLWEGILLDGHNRLEIREEHGLPYTTTTVKLADREAAADCGSTATNSAVAT